MGLVPHSVERRHDLAHRCCVPVPAGPAGPADGGGGAVSGLLTTYLPGPNAFVDPDRPAGLGLYAMLTGVWFGVVIAIALARWGNRPPVGLGVAALATWIAWEIAVNVAMQIVGPAQAPGDLRYYVAGFAAGAVGAFVTWGGAAAWARALRDPRTAAAITLTGALFGLLLPLSLGPDLPVVLFVPWQAAVAGMLGWSLATGGARPRPQAA